MKTKEIFPQAEVGDITVRPWKFGVLFKISSFLGDVLDKMEEKKIVINEDGILPYTTMVRIFTIASDSILKIIAITLDKEEKEIMELDMDEGVEIAMIIYRQNTEKIRVIINELFTESKKAEEDKEEQEDEESK